MRVINLNLKVSIFSIALVYTRYMLLFFKYSIKCFYVFFQTWASSSYRNVFDSVMPAVTTATSQFSSPQPCSSEIQYHPNTEQVSDNSLDDSTDRWDASSNSSDCEITSGKYLESFIKRCFVVTECIMYYFEIHQNHLIHFHHVRTSTRTEPLL